MKNRVLTTRTGLDINQATEGDRLEIILERMMQNGEPIGNEAPLIFTERKDNVQPAYNIRTDRFDLAIDGMDKIASSRQARREGNLKIVEDKDEKNESGTPESTGGQVTEN